MGRRRKPPPAAHAVASNDDLLRDIFLRLRPKQLARFKLVSKRWNSLISDPDLLRNRPPKPAVGLIFRALGVIPFFVAPFDNSDLRPEPPSFPINQHFSSIAFVHACNGLMLCSGKDNESGTGKYFVINPTTVKYTTLPERDESMAMLGMCLAFDPSRSRHYKVVCVSGISEPNTSSLYEQFEVYSSETRSWRVRSFDQTPSFTGNLDLDIENGAYWNGALHWITKNRELDSICFNPDDDDIEDHRRVFPTPPDPYWVDMKYTGHLTYFGESCGHLHFVVYNTKNYNLTVYEMRRDYSEWFVKYTSRVDVRSCGDIRRMDFFDSHKPRGVDSIHALVRGKKDDDCFLIFRVLGRITVRYNIVCRRHESTHDNLLYPFYYRGFPLPYFESMCPV